MDSPPFGTVTLRIKGMNCAGCARHVQEALCSVPSVGLANVMLEQGLAQARWSTQVPGNVDQLIQAVRQAGFDAEELPVDERGTPHSALAVWRFHVIFAFLFTLPLMAGEWLLGWGSKPEFQWVALAFSAPVLAVSGGKFFAGAWHQLKRGAATMDTLVALGSATAFVYSVWVVLNGSNLHAYFMEASAIIAFISLGHWLEAIASERAASAFKSLLHLVPDAAVRLEPDGSESTVPLASIQPGDRILLRPGDRIPVDGNVVEGKSWVNESVLTGESMPVEKEPGSPAYTGTENLDGRLVVAATMTGSQTALARIIEHVQRAQASRANIQRLADRVSNVFVPMVIATALAAALGWTFNYDTMLQWHHWLAAFLPHGTVPNTAGAAGVMTAAAVLIVACPCAMGLATPIALLVGSQAAARRGILIRDAGALEKSGNIDLVAFDKTGTLTQGKAAVIEIVECLRDASTELPSLKSIAASLAAPSRHPISAAVSKIETSKLPISDWNEKRGFGVEAVCGNLPIATTGEIKARMGSMSWIESCGAKVNLEQRMVVADSSCEIALSEWIPRQENTGATLLGVAFGRHVLGFIAVRDVLKPDVATAIQMLRAEGLAVRLLTGDREQSAAALGESAGFKPDEIVPRMLPEAKSEWLRRAQAQGRRIAFVGDGINDAPALEQADLGIAVSSASDIAKESADIVLLKSDVLAIPEALRLARATLRTIRQNLFWAFFYNALAVPLAALGFLSPVICAAAMGLSDLIVIGNAMRLRRFQGR